MAYREVRVVDYREVIRRWLAGDGFRALSRGTGLDRKTVRRIVRAAQQSGLKPGDPMPDDKAIAVLFSKLKGSQKAGTPGETESSLFAFQERIRQWLKNDKLLLTRVHDLLAREGVLVPYTSLHRFARKWCDFGRASSLTVRRSDGKPGEYAEVDFGRLGYLQELGNVKPRIVHGFIMVLGYSRLSCVVPVFRQDLESVIGCFEEAFRFFGGCPKRIVLDNLKACIELADPLVPRFTRTFLEYATFRGFIPDPARPYHPKDKPAVEQHVRYVRERFFKGAAFVDLDDVARRALVWCRETAGRRIHGTTRCIPLEVFEAEEKSTLIPLNPERFVVPKWVTCVVHPDHHVRFDSALYSAPSRYVGKEVDVRADGALVRIYYGGEVIKTHKQQPRGGRSTDYEDYPKDRAPYAMRYPDFYRRKAREIGPAVGDFADKLLEGEFPWSRLRQAQKLLRLTERYGRERAEAACLRALSVDLIDVTRVGHILEQALEGESAPGSEAPQPPLQQKLRFLRPAQHFSHHPASQGGNHADKA
jgi:transposase